MQWVAGGLVPCVRRLVDEHGVHGHDVRAYQRLDDVQYFRLAAILRENRVQLEVLYLVDRVLAFLVFPTGYVLHYGHEGWFLRRLTNLLESSTVPFQLTTLVQASDDKEAVLVVEVQIILR